MSAGWRSPGSCARPLLIAGATGVLGLALARASRWRGLDHVITDRATLPLNDSANMAATLDAVRPWAVINAAGWVRVDDAEHEPRACIAANAIGASQLAAACAKLDIMYVGFSSDLAFDGRLGRPYVETDVTAPLSAYGRSKAQGEQLIRVLAGRSLMIRTAAFFSPHDSHNFAAQVERHLAVGLEFVAADDVTISPTYVPDLVEAVLDLAIDGAEGLWHLVNSAAVTWADFAGIIARGRGLDATLVRGVSAAKMGWLAERPRFAPLATIRGQRMPDLEDAVARYAAALPGPPSGRPATPKEP